MNEFSLRKKIRDGLEQLPESNHNIFRRMYSPENMMANIYDVVDRMSEDKLSWALFQVERSIDLRKENKMTLEDKIKEWVPIAEKLKETKKIEMALRVEICEEMINGTAGKPLTTKAKAVVNIGNMKVDANSKTSLKIDQEIYDDIEEELSPEALQCIKNTKSVIKSKIENLADDDDLFDAVYEVPATPTLSVKYLDE